MVFTQNLDSNPWLARAQADLSSSASVPKERVPLSACARDTRLLTAACAPSSTKHVTFLP
jgi:hypothetical protein